MKSGDRILWKWKVGTVLESEAGRLPKPLIESALRVLLLCVAYFSLSPSCFGQQNQRFDELLADTASQTKPDFLRIGGQEAQSTAPTKANAPAQPEAQKGKKKKPARGAIVVAPLPISSPAIGSGIVPVLGYIFPFSTKDKVSPPSTVGVAGLITNNGSRGFVIGAQLFLKENTYEITSGFARGNVDYNIYGNGVAEGVKLPLNQTGEAFMLEVLRRVGWKFFVGPRFITGNSFITIRPNDDMNFPIPPEAGLHTNLRSVGARLTRDTRPNHFYPIGGTFFSFTSDFFSQGLGSKYSFQSYRTQFDKYFSLSTRQVLAYDAYFCATGGQPPFYGNCIYGANNELRGYTAGRYFTRYALATQLEYRLVLPWRFGLVAFGGVGGTIPGGKPIVAAGPVGPFPARRRRGLAI